jgi:hypothetical protein
MDSVAKKYKVVRRFNLDFEIVVQGRNEEEAAYSADSIELESWNEVDSSWELIDVTRVSHLVLVEDKEERETSKPVIKIWKRT